MPPGSSFGSFNSAADDTTQRKKDNLLLAAVKAGDANRIEQALAEGANPNTQDGLPLRITAENDDYLTAKTLMQQNADIGYALLQARTENEAIPREYKGSGVFSYRQAKTSEGRVLEQKLNKIIGRLDTFQKTYLESSMPQEQMILMREMQERLIRMEKQIKQLTEPQKLEKSGTKLSAPTPAGKP